MQTVIAKGSAGMLRYVRAVYVTLWMLARGEKPPGVRHVALLEWAKQTPPLVDAVVRAADSAGLDADRRAQITVRADGRDMSMATVLGAVRHNAANDYPFMLHGGSPHSLLGVQATNFNDQYRVSRLLEIPAVADAPAVRTALARLQTHLGSIPASAQNEKA